MKPESKTRQTVYDFTNSTLGYPSTRLRNVLKRNGKKFSDLPFMYPSDFMKMVGAGESLLKEAQWLIGICGMSMGTARPENDIRYAIELEIRASVQREQAEKSIRFLNTKFTC